MNWKIRIMGLLFVMAIMTGIGTATSLGYGTVYEKDGTTAAVNANVKIYSDSTLSDLLGEGMTNGYGEYDIVLSSGYSGLSVFVKATKLGKEGTATADKTGTRTTHIYLADITLIPEFPTVAAPIAAVLGLVFFFRKNK